jgi:phage tail sheath protein FI
MADSLSPGIKIKEIDLTTVVRAASSTIGAYVGRFNWGPLGTVELVSTETELGSLFGEPKAVFSATALDANSIATSFLTASSYLAYSNSLRVSRVANINDSNPSNNAKNAVADLATSGTPTGILVKNSDDYLTKDALSSFASYFLIGKYAGIIGNSIKFSACFTANQFKSPAIPNSTGDWTLEKEDSGRKTLSAALIDLTTHFVAGDYVEFTYDGQVYKNKVEIVTSTKLTLANIGSTLPYFPMAVSNGIVTSVKKVWEYASAFNGAPSTNEFHLVLVDATGNITGEAGAVLELFPYLSSDIAKKNVDGTTAYYKTVLNDQSKFVWVGGVSLTSNLASASYLTKTKTLESATNGTTPTQDDYIQAAEIFLDKDNINISTFICPPLMDTLDDATVPNYLIQNLAEVRKDIVIYLSPKYSDVVNKPGLELGNVITFRNTLPSSSYAFMDSGWKYMYDKYNNTYRWVPLCGDIAGTAARTDDEQDSWWSHAGLNRGGIKNCIRLAWNPNQSRRDDLYQVGVNPVITSNGVGTILYGDKTLLSRPSSFDRINVRRLFIVLEKAIADAAKYSLFEFNDEITRTRFVTMIEPFLRDIKSRRGISDFYVKCDATNNTPQVIDTNRFIGSVLVKPNRSINFITLNFVSVPTGISFDTVVGTI